MNIFGTGAGKIDGVTRPVALSRGGIIIMQYKLVFNAGIQSHCTFLRSLIECMTVYKQGLIRFISPW